MDKADQSVMLFVTYRYPRMLDVAKLVYDLRYAHVVLKELHTRARRHDLNDLGLSRLKQIVDKNALRRIQHALLCHVR